MFEILGLISSLQEPLERVAGVLAPAEKFAGVSGYGSPGTAQTVLAGSRQFQCELITNQLLTVRADKECGSRLKLSLLG